jgi:hypothetical protein
MNSWYTIVVSIPKLKKLLGSKIENKNLNGQKLIILSCFMDGEKKLLMVKLSNFGDFKTVGEMIGEKLLMDKRMDGLECKEVKILMELKVLLKLLSLFL